MFLSRFFSIAIFIFIIPVYALTCQVDSAKSSLQMVEMKSGNIFFVNIIAEDSSSVLINNLSGQRIQLKKQDILRILTEWKRIKENYILINLIDGTSYAVKVENYRDSSFIVKNSADIEMIIPGRKIAGFKNLKSGNIESSTGFDPNRTRLFFIPTARPLNAGEGYFSDYMIFFPFVAVGVTDFASISGGFSLVPGVKNQIVYGNLKITFFENDNFGFSTGMLYTNISGNSGGILYGIATVGTNDNALTFGLGNGFTGEEGFSQNPILVLGGEVRLSNSLKLLTENWIPTDVNQPVVSFGLRFFSDHVAGDFGLITFSALRESNGFPFIPWLSFTYNFGN